MTDSAAFVSWGSAFQIKDADLLWGTIRSDLKADLGVLSGA